MCASLSRFGLFCFVCHSPHICFFGEERRGGGRGIDEGEAWVWLHKENQQTILHASPKEQHKAEARKNVRDILSSHTNLVDYIQ